MCWSKRFITNLVMMQNLSMQLVYNLDLYFIFNWIFNLFTFQRPSSLFPGFPSENPLFHPQLPCLYMGARPPIYPFTPHHPSIPLHCGIKPSQNQGLPLPLMSDKVPSVLSVFPLAPPVGSLCSVRWWTASICICIGQDLAEHLRRYP